MSKWLELQGKGKSTRELRVIYWHKEGAQGMVVKKMRRILGKNRDFLPILELLPCFTRSRLALLRQELLILLHTIRADDLMILTNSNLALTQTNFLFPFKSFSTQFY